MTCWLRFAKSLFFANRWLQVHKAASSRLDPLSYESLRQQILRRDGWRCKSCGTMSNLEVHHREFRSHSGADSEENLITLCAACHARVHCR
jgi:5-methylcytosine-specific restriction endonuclease McrA